MIHLRDELAPMCEASTLVDLTIRTSGLALAISFFKASPLHFL